MRDRNIGKPCPDVENLRADWARLRTAFPASNLSNLDDEGMMKRMIINKGCLYFRECTKEESRNYEKDYDTDFCTSLPSDFSVDGKIGIDSFIGYPIHAICATPSGGVCATQLTSDTKKFFIFWID